MSRSLGQASHPTMPVFMTPNVRNRDHGVVKQTNKHKQKLLCEVMLLGTHPVSDSLKSERMHLLFKKKSYAFPPPHL